MTDPIERGPAPVRSILEDQTGTQAPDAAVAVAIMASRLSR